MNNRFWRIIAIVMCIALVFCVVQIERMNNQLEQLQSNLSHQFRDINNGISSIYNNVSNKLEEQASLINHADWEFGAADYDAQIVRVNMEVTPKQYSPEKTTASLVYDGGTVPMTLAGGTYKAELKLGFFDTAKIEKVLLETDGVVQTELLGWSIVPRYDFLPIVNIDMSISYTGRPDKNTQIFAVDYDSDLNMNIANIRPEQNPNETTVYTYMDGKLIDKKVLAWDPNMQESDEYYTHGYAADKGKWEIPFGSTLEIYGSVVIDGLYHVCKLEEITVTAEGTLADRQPDWSWRGAEADVYDADGKLIYWYDDGSASRVQQMR